MAVDRLENYDLDTAAKFTFANYARLNFAQPKSSLLGSAPPIEELIRHAKQITASLTKLPSDRQDDALQTFKSKSLPACVLNLTFS